MNEAYYVSGFALKRLGTATATDKAPYSNVTTFRAHIQPLSGAYPFQSGKDTYSATHRIYAPTSVSARAGDRITFLGSDYRVAYVQPSIGIAGQNIHQEFLVELTE